MTRGRRCGSASALTVLNITLNVVLITGAGPIPEFGTRGAAIGTVIASGIVSAAAMWMIFAGRLVIHFPRSMSLKPDWEIIRSLFRFGLPAGIQGVAMNIGGVLLLRFIGSLEHSAEAQAAYAVGYAELFSLITWTSVGLMGAAAAVAGQNLGAGRPERSMHAVHMAARIGLCVAAFIGALFILIPQLPAGDLRRAGSGGRVDRDRVVALSERVRILHHRRADVYGRAAGNGRHAQPALHLDCVAGSPADRAVRGVAEHGQARDLRCLDGHSARPLHAVRPERSPLPSREVEGYCCGMKELTA